MNVQFTAKSLQRLYADCDAVHSTLLVVAAIFSDDHTCIRRGRLPHMPHWCTKSIGPTLLHTGPQLATCSLEYICEIPAHAASGVASCMALGHVPPPPTSNNFIFSSLWSRPKADSQILCSLRDQLVQMSTTRIQSVLH